MLPNRFLLPASAGSYFRSGWAFLIPYLAAYLLYAWLKWPVHPPNTGQEGVVPSLLHVYWALHAGHLALGFIVLRSWWQGRSSASRQVAGPGFRVSALWPLLPWLCLALIFWIPGVYLEWPSDPWDHLDRIVWWSDMDFVTADSSWLKSGYFIPYSLLSWATGSRQIFWLHFYHAGICLLLSWQYFLLARACGLGRRASTVFVLLQALLFGNNIFSFYRYYGISSSIYAQLGAVALTRVAIEAARGGLVRPRSGAHGGDGNLPAAGAQRPSSLPSAPPAWLLPGASAVLLLILIALNHVQGLGLAGLGVGAVVVWRLVQWNRSVIIGLAAIATLLSVAAVLWYPRDAGIVALYQAQGWLNAWYGFDLFDPGSAAFERSMHILGAFGLLNLATGVWLLRRNHLAGWLTLVPIVALVLPCVALPFAQFIAAHTHTSYIITFHRMLLAIPTGLALVTTVSELLNRDYARGSTSVLFGDGTARGLEGLINAPAALPRICAFLLIPMALGAALAAPPRTPNSINLLGYNRVWNALAIVPDDLRRSSAEGQTSAMSQAGYLSQHWAPSRNVSLPAHGH